MTGRVDHQFDTKNSLFVRYSLNFDREFWPSGTVPESLHHASRVWPLLA